MSGMRSSQCRFDTTASQAMIRDEVCPIKPWLDALHLNLAATTQLSIAVLSRQRFQFPFASSRPCLREYYKASLAKQKDAGRLTLVGISCRKVGNGEAAASCSPTLLNPSCDVHGRNVVPGALDEAIREGREREQALQRTRALADWCNQKLRENGT